MLPLVKPTGDYDRDITGGFFPRPVKENRHLPGKHDQKTHGHGHKAGGYKAGAWNKVSNEDRIRQIEANLHEDLYPAVVQEMGPDGVRKLAERMAGSNGVVYTNGENHRVHFSSDQLTEAEHKDLLANVDEMQRLAPLDKLDLDVAAQHSFRQGVGGETEVGTGNIRLNETIYTKYDRTGLMFGTPGWVMPINERVSVSRYVLAHEWGHAVDTQTNNPRGQKKFMRPDDLQAVGLVSGMSQYGQTHTYEGYAEAFAEFALTGGKTSNLAVKIYADAYDWRGRWPSLATTS